MVCLTAHRKNRKLLSDSRNGIFRSGGGDVRELEHLIQRLSTLVRGNVIRRDDLPAEILEKRPDSGLLE